MNNELRKIYLGDSVYVSYDGIRYCLTTENGNGPSNTIFLEPEIIDRLNIFVEMIRSGK